MLLKDIEIRETENRDIKDILEVEEKAFGYVKEAELTSDLLNDETAKPALSLLAFYKGEAAGHILFTRVYIEERSDQPLLHILAPLAVKPSFQKQGIGGMLINDGLNRLTKSGSEMVFVLGHMEYYPRFGFIPDAGKLGYSAPYPIPDMYSNAWMVRPLTFRGLSNNKGKILCADVLNRPEHWRE